MDFDEAIAAHAIWKMKLAKYLHKPDKSLCASEAASPNKCELGAWIYGAGRMYSTIPEYATLVSSHESFHKAAGEIIKRADSGQDVSEEIALGTKSAFSVASSEVVQSIMILASKTRKA